MISNASLSSKLTPVDVVVVNPEELVVPSSVVESTVISVVLEYGIRTSGYTNSCSVFGGLHSVWQRPQ